MKTKVTIEVLSEVERARMLFEGYEKMRRDEASRFNGALEKSCIELVARLREAHLEEEIYLIEEIKKSYEKAQRKEKSRSLGLLKVKQIKFAKILINHNHTTDEIAEDTGLSREEIENLRAQL